MTLGEIVIQYRLEHNLSQRQFAEKCELSNGYISMVEKGINPKTNRPIVPQITQIKKLANGMGISAHKLLDAVDNLNIDLSKVEQEDDRFSEISNIYHGLNDEGQEEMLDHARYLQTKEKFIAAPPASDGKSAI